MTAAPRVWVEVILKSQDNKFKKSLKTYLNHEN